MNLDIGRLRLTRKASKGSPGDRQQILIGNPVFARLTVLGVTCDTVRIGVEYRNGSARIVSLQPGRGSAIVGGIDVSVQSITPFGKRFTAHLAFTGPRHIRVLRGELLGDEVAPSAAAELAA